ncbi:MAG: dethiobiotin synthase [Candidatus Melainabacteria bacterium]
MQAHPCPTWVITGTDTEVGKTVVTAALAAALLTLGKRVSVFKPVQTGISADDTPDDPTQIRQWLTPALSGKLSTACDLHLREPAAPWVADSENVIHMDSLLAATRQAGEDADCLLVEGAGGVMVPFTKQDTFLDFMTALQAPVILVTRPDLGTINHTLLSLSALQSRGLTVAAIVVNRYPLSTDPATLPVAVATLPEVLRQYAPNIPLILAPDTPLSPGCVDADHPLVRALAPLIC